MGPSVDSSKYFCENGVGAPVGLGVSLTVGYTYNAYGNRAMLTYPDGLVVAYTYTHRNEMTSITADGPPPLATYGYDTNGNRISKSLENSTSAA